MHALKYRHVFLKVGFTEIFCIYVMSAFVAGYEAQNNGGY